MTTLSSAFKVYFVKDRIKLTSVFLNFLIFFEKHLKVTKYRTSKRKNLTSSEKQLWQQTFGKRCVRFYDIHAGLLPCEVLWMYHSPNWIRWGVIFDPQLINIILQKTYHQIISNPIAFKPVFQDSFSENRMMLACFIAKLIKKESLEGE